MTVEVMNGDVESDIILQIRDLMAWQGRPGPVRARDLPI